MSVQSVFYEPRFKTVYIILSRQPPISESDPFIPLYVFKLYCVLC